jgi:hypothetical protein
MHRTTLPVTPGAIIGYRRNGMPVRLIAGGSEPAPPAPANGAPEQAQPPAASAAPVPAPPPSAPDPASPAAANAPEGQPQQGSQQAGSVDELPGWAQKLIRDTRSENAAHRTKVKELTDAQAAAEGERTRQMDKLAEALGLKPGEATPEQIAAERDAAHARAETASAHARTTSIELAAFRAAASLQADPNKVLDSRAFVATLEGLDPADPAFAQLVSDKVAAALESNPAWRVAPAAAPAAPAQAAVPGQPYPQAAQAQPYAAPPLQAPAIPASGPQGAFTAAPPGPRQLTEGDAMQMSPAQVVDAINKGLFTETGFGPNSKARR